MADGPACAKLAPGHDQIRRCQLDLPVRFVDRSHGSWPVAAPRRWAARRCSLRASRTRPAPGTSWSARSPEAHLAEQARRRPAATTTCPSTSRPRPSTCGIRSSPRRNSEGPRRASSPGPPGRAPSWPTPPRPALLARTPDRAQQPRSSPGRASDRLWRCSPGPGATRPTSNSSVSCSICRLSPDPVRTKPPGANSATLSHLVDCPVLVDAQNGEGRWPITSVTN